MQFSAAFLHIELADAVTARCWLLLEIFKGHQFVSSRPTVEMIKANICIQSKPCITEYAPAAAVSLRSLYLLDCCHILDTYWTAAEGILNYFHI